MAAAVLILFAAVAAMYLVAAATYALQFASERPEPSGAWLRTERAATILLHALFLAALGWRYREIPLVSGWNMLTITALALTIVYSILEYRFQARGTGVFFLGLALLCHLASWPGVRPPAAQSDLLRNPIFGVHVAVALLGYVGFLVSALYGAFYLAMYRGLKTSRPSRFLEKMPPLDLVADMNNYAAIVGFLCMTVAIFLGIVLSIHLRQPFGSDAQFIQTLAAWVLYGGLLGGRYALRWRGRLQAGASVAVFAAMIASMLIVRLFFHSFHQFG